jgi:hypothetical protein
MDGGGWRELAFLNTANQRFQKVKSRGTEGFNFNPSVHPFFLPFFLFFLFLSVIFGIHQLTCKGR